MNNTKLAYFDEEDILHLAISDEPEGGSIELSPNITAELNDKGEMNLYLNTDRLGRRQKRLSSGRKR